MSEVPPGSPPPHPSYPPPPPPPYPAPSSFQSWPATPPPGPPSRRRPVLALVVGVVGAVLAVAAAVVVPRLVGHDEGSDLATVTRESTEGATDLGIVESYRDLATTHVTKPYAYPQSPPVGGPHFSTWLDCGVYDAPVPNDHVVHDLEHGTVWITYRPGLDAGDVDTLADLLPDNGILSPYPDLRAAVVVTVWGRQLAVAGADDPMLEEFIDDFSGGITAPEPIASCTGGTADPDSSPGVVPA